MNTLEKKAKCWRHIHIYICRALKSNDNASTVICTFDLRSLRLLTVGHRPKNAHFANIIWWTAGAYANDIGSLAPSDTSPDRLAIARNMFEGDNHETLARSTTWTEQNRIVQSNQMNILMEYSMRWYAVKLNFVSNFIENKTICSWTHHLPLNHFTTPIWIQFWMLAVS